MININYEGGLAASVIDHHGLIDSPILLGGSLVSNYYKLFDRNKFGDILTFATGNIPLNEPFRRRGIMFKGKRINLFPKADKNKIFYSLPKQKIDIIERIQKAHEWHKYNNDEKKFFEEIGSLIKNIDFSSCEYLSDQITKINFYLWPRLFEKNLRENLENLISLEYDDIVAEYFIHVIENEKESFIFKMLFDNNYRAKTLNFFEGIVGAWNEESGSGTHFFWGIDENHERLKFKLTNNALVANNGYEVKLNEKDITSALRSKKILLGMLLKFSLIVFYMGLKPLAGFGSIEYLTRIKARIIDFLKNDFPDEIKNIACIELDGFISLPLTLEKIDGKIQRINAFDVFYRGGMKKEYFDKLSKIPFKNFMAPLLSYYTYAIAKYGSEKDKEIKFELSPDLLNSTLENLFI